MTNLKRFPDNVRAAYAETPTSLVADAMSRFQIGNFLDGLRPLGGKKRLVGRLRTVLYLPRTGVQGQSHSVYSACEMLDEGDVLLLAASGANGWLFGQNIAHFCMRRGCSGIVTNASIRDSLDIARMEFPVFASGTSARPANRQVEIAALDVPVNCAGANLQSGDLLIADEDGIAVVLHAFVEILIPEMDEIARLDREQGLAIKNGASASDLKTFSKQKKRRLSKVEAAAVTERLGESLT